MRGKLRRGVNVSVRLGGDIKNNLKFLDYFFGRNKRVITFAAPQGKSYLGDYFGRHIVNRRMVSIW